MIDRIKDVGRLNLKTGCVDMTHGAGGLASVQLIEAVFAKHFTNEWLDVGHDGALLPPIAKPVAVSCDAHVVTPLFFPGGDIGRLAVAGTVNDVAMCGAKPLYITASFILEEGLPLADLDRIVYIYTFDTGQFKACIFDLFLQSQNVFHLPCFTGSGAIQCGDYAGHTGNLSDLL